MFERPRSGERTILVHVDFPGAADPEDLLEFTDLARSAGARPVATITARRSAPEPRHYVGSGKAEEIRARLNAEQAELVIFNHELSPSQERNLEKLLQARVLDRTGLILDIFAQRATTREAVLQVSLAQPDAARLFLVASLAFLLWLAKVEVDRLYAYYDVLFDGNSHFDDDELQASLALEAAALGPDLGHGQRR